MKTFSNLFKGFFVASILSLALTGCSEDAMDKINNDTNHTTNAPAKFILADVITSTAFMNVGGDLNTYTGTYVEHEVGTHNQLYRAEWRQNEPSAASTFDNNWGNIYTTLKNARIIIGKCSEGGEQSGNQVTKGIAEVLAALNSGLIADIFGDAPYSEATLSNPNGTPMFMNPKIDKQADIYTSIMTLLDNAIIDLQGEDAHLSGSVREYDLMYQGDATKWLKLAYGLKARYTMHLMKQSADVKADMENVLEYTSKSFASADEQAAFAIYDASNLNPLFDFWWSRSAIAASQSMSDKLIERNDPRMRRVFVSSKWEQMSGADHADFLMAPNGEPEQTQDMYNTSIFVFAQTAPTLLMSYHEILFLRAEALCRLNKTAEAETVLKDAVVAGMANMEIAVKAAITSPTILIYGGVSETSKAVSAEETATYFEKNVTPLFKANPLKETMIQKYIAFFGASGESTECYNDIRRMKALGENFVELKNQNKFPLRCPYGNSDTTANPEVKAAYGDGQYVYSEPVWWAGGTR